MKRLTSKRPWEEAREDLKAEYGYSHIWKRLQRIEDILGEDYDLDRLRELVEADRDGRCVVYQAGHNVVSYYHKEGHLFIRECSGVVREDEYEAALKGERDG